MKNFLGLCYYANNKWKKRFREEKRVAYSLNLKSYAPFRRRISNDLAPPGPPYHIIRYATLHIGQRCVLCRKEEHSDERFSQFYSPFLVSGVTAAGGDLLETLVEAYRQIMKFDSEYQIRRDLSDIYQLRISIVGSKPWIWRRIQVSEDTEILNLGFSIMKAVGWCDEMGEYDCGFERRRDTDRAIEIGNDPEAIFVPLKTTVRSLFRKWGNPVRFCWNKGDKHWAHLVLREKIVPRIQGRVYPICIRGSKACPPLFCKNIEDYNELLLIKRNPSHPKYEEKEKLLENFNPNCFRNRRYIGGALAIVNVERSSMSTDGAEN